jgi:hypothetical protein
MFLLLRAVNKANNPWCQGHAKHLQRFQNEERKIGASQFPPKAGVVDKAGRLLTGNSMAIGYVVPV